MSEMHNPDDARNWEATTEDAFEGTYSLVAKTDEFSTYQTARLKILPVACKFLS